MLRLSKLLRPLLPPQALRKHFCSSQSGAVAFSSITRGSKYTVAYSKYLQLPNGEVGSYFHDVPLDLDENEHTVNMVVEIPRWSNGKFEISKDIDLNPIKQDSKKGIPRFVSNIFPFKGFIHNYGALPQTWENPISEMLPGLKGDNDPLDCCELGSAVLETGQIRRVKLLGSIALIDGGELDWKVIVIDVQDPLADNISNLDDVEREFPKLLGSIRSWFRDYKLPDGKPRNEFAFEGEYQDVHKTLEVIKECHSSWRQLLNGEVSYSEAPKTGRCGGNVTLAQDELPDHEIPHSVNNWHYI